jgi:hypothetical protein
LAPDIPENMASIQILTDIMAQSHTLHSHTPTTSDSRQIGSKTIDQ